MIRSNEYNIYFLSLTQHLTRNFTQENLNVAFPGNLFVLINIYFMIFNIAISYYYSSLRCKSFSTDLKIIVSHFETNSACTDITIWLGHFWPLFEFNKLMKAGLKKTVIIPWWCSWPLCTVSRLCIVCSVVWIWIQ